jgi:hypothetical protein
MRYVNVEAAVGELRCSIGCAYPVGFCVSVR